ncbi:MAG: hypothetical protein H6757_01760 [Candidatus Omnitrophica bacterium]|nr:hypothetical protein [Candidatus Omnitrophota bacterium]
MNIEEFWNKALKKTEIIRSRIQPLPVFQATHLPYVFLAESTLNPGDTVVRKGQVLIERPSIVLPDHLPQFDGFELEKDFPGQHHFLNTLFLVRGIRFPSLKYNHVGDTLDLYEGGLSSAIEYHRKTLQQIEDTATGLAAGPEDCWQFSIMILIAHQVLRQADGDIRKLLEQYKKNE